MQVDLRISDDTGRERGFVQNHPVDKLRTSNSTQRTSAIDEDRYRRGDGGGGSSETQGVICHIPSFTQLENTGDSHYCCCFIFFFF